MLLDGQHQVVVLDSFLYGGAGLETVRSNPRLKIIEGDICHISDVVRAVKGVDAVIALAAIVGDPACNLSEEETLNTNYEATKVLVEICNYYKVQRLLFASSCSVYGAADDLVLNEGSLLNPVSLYARTRIMSEEVIIENSNDRLVSTILRMGTLYGWSARMRFDLVVNFMTAKGLAEGALDVYGGNQWRPFVHVQDAACAYVRALKLPPSVLRHQIYNVGSNEQNYRISAIAECVKAALRKVKVRTHRQVEDQRNYRISFDKFSSVFGLKPRFNVRSGIAEIARYLRKCPVDYSDEIYYNVKYLYRRKRCR
jgi:nucleoside-diphosphate-sugar epimerase